MKREVIAFIGRQGSGKSFQSAKLVKERGFKKVSFADPLREIAFNILGMDFEEGMKRYDELKQTELFNGLNFRNILENLGASIRKYDKDFWAVALIKTISVCPDNIVIDDMRYPNEYESLRTFCGTKGYSFKAYYCDHRSDVYVADNKHESAGLSNYLSEIGYHDLQLIERSDVFKYSVIINDNINKTTENVNVVKPVDIQKAGKEVIALLKGLKK